MLDNLQDDPHTLRIQVTGIWRSVELLKYPGQIIRRDSYPSEFNLDFDLPFSFD